MSPLSFRMSGRLRGPSLAAAGFLIASLCILHGAAYAGPRLEALTPVVDLGTINPRDLSYIGGEIRFRNSGDENLEITKITFDCGCLEAHLKKARLAPGEAGSADFTIDADMALPGLNVKKIYLHSNDPLLPMRTFEVRFNLKADLDWAPTELVIHGDVDSMRPGQRSFSGKIMLRDNWEEKLVVESVEVSDFLMERTIHENWVTYPSGKIVHFYRFHVAFPSGWPPGPIDEHLLVRTNHPEYPEVRIPIRGEIKGIVKMEPPYIEFKPGTTFWDEDFQTEVRLRAGGKIIVLGDIVTNAREYEVKFHDNGTQEPRIIIKKRLVPLPGTNEGGESPDYYGGVLRFQVLEPIRYTQAFKIYGPIGVRPR